MYREKLYLLLLLIVRLCRHLLRFEQRDVLTYEPCVADCYDVIVSNPPYVTGN